MNILTDKLPSTVNVGGEVLDINTDFRTCIKFELLIQESDDDNKSKLVKALTLFFNKIPCNVEKAIESIIWFYSCGVKPDTNQNNTAQRQYSFDFDADYIYSAFLQYYHIDLTKVKMHWWQFKSLFRALPDDCKFSQIIYYRTVTINSKMSKSEQERIRKLKNIYALPVLKSEKSKLDEIEKALMGNGDISGLIHKGGLDSGF